jgi:hypothetical protein
VPTLTTTETWSHNTSVLRIVVVLVGTTVASVGHLIIMKRFEIELKIEI